MPYKAIGFDYGGVINGVPGFVFMQAMAKFLNVPIDVLQETFFQNNYRSSIGEMSWIELWEYISVMLHRSEKSRDIATFIHKWDEDQQVNPNILHLIDTLHSFGYRIGLLSNWENGLRDRLSQQGITNYFDVIGISSEMGVMKPEPEAFLKFCEMLGVSPQELVFIDDSKKSLETAEVVGYKPILFRDYVGLVQDLASLGIKV